MLIPGPQLTRTQREHVLAAFVHRWTTGNSHRPHVYDLEGTGHGIIPPTIPPVTDDEWIATHSFYFVADGSRLSARHRRAVPYYPPTASIK